MRYLFLFTLLLTISTFASAQDKEYKASTDGWLVDIEEAYSISQKTGKPILANFTGSDWCGFCIKLKAAVFVKPEWKKWADENVVLLELDFPRRMSIPNKYQQQNQSLASAFEVRGYPTVWLFNLERDPKTKQFSIDPYGKTGYSKSSKQFIDSLEKMIQRRKNTE